MKGKEILITNKGFTLDELEEFMLKKWNTVEYNEFIKGKPNPLTVEEYIMLPATKRFLVLVYPRKVGSMFSKKNKVILVVSQTPKGNMEMFASVAPFNNLLMGAWKTSNLMSSEKERKGPAEEILQIYTAYMRGLLRESGYLAE